MYTHILSHRRGLYLKVSAVIGLLAIAVFISQFYSGTRVEGSTWQGYTLGISAVVMVFFLGLLGWRKRQYQSHLGSVQDWTSAHVYIGVLLLLVSTLHTGGQLGWNVHTAAYLFMLVVIVSGIVGIYFYFYFPRVASRNLAGHKRGEWMAELNTLDDEAWQLSGGCQPEVQQIVRTAVQGSAYGGGIWAQLSGQDYSRLSSTEGGKSVSNSGQRLVIDYLAQRIPMATNDAEISALNTLLAVFGRRQTVLNTLRRDIQIQSLLKIWVYVHLPVTVSFLVLLFIHIATVLVYW